MSKDGNIPSGSAAELKSNAHQALIRFVGIAPFALTVRAVVSSEVSRPRRAACRTFVLAESV